MNDKVEREVKMSLRPMISLMQVVVHRFSNCDSYVVASVIEHGASTQQWNKCNNGCGNFAGK